MGLIELLLVAVGLSMDAFAVAVCRGLNMTKINYRHSVIIALFFGFFQGLMPLIGWLLGTRFEHYISSVDHWVAFALLGFIGGKMIFEALRPEEEESEQCSSGLNLKELFVMAIATSIDALAVGITFAILPGIDIWSSIGLIGIVTFALSFLGVLIGNRFGARYKKKAELFGGIVLVLIGIKILIDHLI